MTDISSDENAIPKKGSKKKLLIFVVLSLLGLAGGFYLGWAGIVGGKEQQPHENVESGEVITAYSYISMDPIIISLPPTATSKHLRFRAELEVLPEFKSEIEGKMPRVIDIINGYLRAIEVDDFENRAVLYQLKRNILHRVSLVVGPKKVNSVLILEFILT